MGMMIRWVVNISSRSPKLEWTSLTHITPYIAKKIRKVTERTNYIYILDALATEYTQQIINLRRSDDRLRFIRESLYQQDRVFLVNRGPYSKLSLSKGSTLQWRHNGRDGVSNHQPHDCLLNRLFRRRSKKTSNLCVTGLCHRWFPRANGQ